MVTTQKQISREAELRFAAEFAKKGWDIFLPFGEDSPIDLLIHKKGKFLKIQVKATKIKNGALICKLRSTNNWQNKKYSEKEIDSFAFYDYKNRKGYLIPIKEIKNLSEIRMRIDLPKNKQIKKIRYAKEYLFFE
jgi:hypothetical protein|tara:strand:- start:754 stop:1158 length:405 start_codon:yes stop_codon:yes gene_type:complete